MKVKRLQINSFRGIGDLTLEFPTDEPIVFIGINGVGKSSILDCLAILLSQFLDLIISKNPIEQRGQKIADTGYSLIHINELYLKKHPSKIDIKGGYSNSHNTITISITVPQELTWSFTIPNRKSVELMTVAKDIIESLHYVNLPLVVYYSVNRAVLDFSLEISEHHSFKPVDAYIHALTGEKTGFGNFFQWFRTLEDLENEERRDNPNHRDISLEAVRQAISSLIPEFSELRVRRSPLRMTVEKEGQELIVDQLSDGEKCLLAMVGDIARRLAIANPGLPDPLQGEGVVLIDEIELHLHPKWQREIIPALTRTFPNCQFIVTTHSPQVLSQVKPEGIYILEATSEGVVARKPESSYGRDSNRILEDLMGVPERPQEIKDRLRELFRLIDDGDIEGAKQLRQQIVDIIGFDEPELVKADVFMRRKEVLKR